MARKNGHLEECVFQRGLGWECAQGCEKAGSEDSASSPPAKSQSRPEKSHDSSKDYSNHPKFAKFQKRGT